jgi:cation diffusion facilitator family transporter
MTQVYAEGYRASTVSLALNGALAVVKLVCGIIGNSYALIADAIESLGDIVSSAIVFGGLVIASRPADENHPYGHGKAEPLAALAVAAILILAAVLIATQAIHEIRNPHTPPAGFTLVVLIVVVIIKETMFRYESRAGHRIGSTAVMVDAWHHRSDAITSAAAAIGISIAVIGGKAYAVADDWAALFACMIIAYNGLRFARTATHELMDTMPESAVLSSIEAAAMRVNGTHQVEKLLVRKVGPRLYVDLHLEVDPMLTVQRGHEIAHAVKDSIRTERKDVADVLVHIEPAANPHKTAGQATTLNDQV